MCLLLLLSPDFEDSIFLTTASPTPTILKALLLLVKHLSLPAALSLSDFLAALSAPFYLQRCPRHKLSPIHRPEPYSRLTLSILDPWVGGHADRSPVTTVKEP
jgi:hypothetical protein